MNKWLPSLFAVSASALTAFTPTIQHAVSNLAVSHPTLFTLIGSSLMVVSHFWTSPADSTSTPKG